MKLNNIWAKISAGFLIILIPIFLLGYISQILFTNALKEQAVQSTTSTIHQTAKNIDNIIVATKELYKQISVDAKFQQYLAEDFDKLTQYEQLKKKKEMESILSEYTGANIFVSKIILIIDEKKSVSPNVGAISSDNLRTIQQALWYKEAQNKKGKMAWIGKHMEIDVVFRNADNADRWWDYSISAAGMVKSYPTNNEIGVLVFNISGINIRKILEGINLGEGSEIHIISPDGRNISLSSLDNEIVMSIDNEFAEEEFINANMQVGKSQGFSFITYKEKKQLMVYEKITDTGYIVIGLLPDSQLVVSAKKIKILTYFLIIITGMFVIIIGVVIIPRNISKRINILISKMIKVENGNLTITKKIKGNDEIGIIDKHFNKMVYKLEALIQDNYVKQLKKREAELNALQFQINPHFLYNTLEAINSIASVNSCFEICKISENLGEMFRYSINPEISDFVSLQMEVNHIKNYIDIQNLRFEERFEVFYDIEESIKKYKVLKFILQPIVENVIIHGFSDNSEKGFLEISAYKEYNDLIINVQDDGHGMTNERLKELNDYINEGADELFKGYKKSIGMKNVNMRIKLACGDKYGIQIKSEKTVGTQVIYTLPILSD